MNAFVNLENVIMAFFLSALFLWAVRGWLDSFKSQDDDKEDAEHGNR